MRSRWSRCVTCGQTAGIAVNGVWPNERIDEELSQSEGSHRGQCKGAVFVRFEDREERGEEGVTE